jgi:hypothetical protein
MVIHVAKPMTSWKFCNLMKRGLRMDTKEKFYICQEIVKGNQLNDKHTVTLKKIFEAVLNGSNLISVCSFQCPSFTALQ